MSRECPDLHSEELYSEWLAELKSEFSQAGLDLAEAFDSDFEFRAAYEDSQKPSETVRDYVMYCAKWLDVKPVWLPIETAPAIGVFLVYLPNERRHCEVMYRSEHTTIVGGAFGFDRTKPTHWMRLPEPPK